MQRQLILRSHVSTLALVLAAGFGVAATPARAACTQDSSGNLTCSGVVTDAGAGSATSLPITLYDVAAQFQPTAGGNKYTPASYNPNPQPLFVTINAGAQLSATITAANNTTYLTDNGVISANYSNSENPAVNNVQVNNNGSLTLINQQSAKRAALLNSDSQVNNFVVNNNVGGSISATQSSFAAFSTANLSATSSGSPATYSAKYAGNTLAITTGLYSDDNTNEFTVNNAVGASITATGNFATAYYGRADATVTNSGTIANTSWNPTDTIAAGHWAIVSWAGTNYNTAPNTNPDSNIVVPNADGSVTVLDTSALTLTNNAGATIRGDIIAMDITPLVYAAAVGSSTNPFANPSQTTLLQLPISSGNAGPRDSNISNSGTIQGNFYLGSGTHVIDNAAGASLQGSIYVDQRPIQAVFAEPNPGTVAGTFLSIGGSDFNGNACPGAGQNTSDAGCAGTTNHTATVVGGQSLTLTNEGTFTGDIRIFDEASSVNSITLTGNGFTGNIVAVNGTGSNSLVLDSDTMTLASVQNFSSIDLMRTNATVTNGVTLVSGAQIGTTIYGPGGTTAAPSTNLGTIGGTLTLAGPTTITPTIAAQVHNGDVYQLASGVAGAGATIPGAISVTPSALVAFTPDTSSGKLLLDASVTNARNIPGISRPGAQTINGLTSYAGGDARVQALAATVESLGSNAQVAAAAAALSPIVNGADVQAPIDMTMAFHQQIDTRLDQYIYGLIPVSGRSADLGVPHAVPVYGALPVDGAWIEGLGGNLRQSNVAGVTGYQAEFEGVLAGYDRLVAPGFRLGGAFGYADTRVNGQSNLQTRESLQTYQGLGYAEYAIDHVYARASAGYGGIDYSSTRQISFAGFSDTAIGQHKGNILTVRGEAGVPYEVAGGLLIPYGAFTYGHLTQDAYTETSGFGTGLAFAGTTNDSERSEIGGKVVVPLTTMPAFSVLFPPATSTLAIEARAAYVHEFGNVGQTVNVAFAGGAPFVVSGPIPDRDMVDFGVGLRAGSGPVQFDISYNGLTRSTFYQQYGLLRARYVF